ncbi:hypothetical protein FB45DRAFT_795337 [Roridomyces roridus]|uniref:SET domain-containing protein n=1 Tax=Roridomyces roridus TaxID=1738132 RepID=A0AAD7FJC7_9AGAR|nr:hypothetical protein FB45DRAFT_795337 [Roridomyces roridus]
MESTALPSFDSTIQFIKLPATTRPDTVLIAEPIIAEIISSQPDFPLPMEDPGEPTYEIRQTKDMGLGMFAVRALKPGELVLSERPALIFPTETASSSAIVAKQEIEAAFEVALDEMPTENRVAYRKLAKGVDVPHAGDLLRIATANNFHLPEKLPGGPTERWKLGDYRAVYLDISRINHSCLPNTIAEFDFASFSFVVHVARKISPGEEITIAYIGLLAAPKAERNRQLSFCMPACKCVACTNPAPSSDFAREAVASLRAWGIIRYLADNLDTPAKAFADMHQCLENIKDEGLQSITTYPLMLDICARIAAMVGDTELADKYRREAGMFYDMRPRCNWPRDFTEWIFGWGPRVSERCKWASSHFDEFQVLHDEWMAKEFGEAELGSITSSVT